MALDPRRALLSILAALPCAAAAGQGPPATAVTGVSLDRTGEDEARWTLVLRGGRIESVLPAGEEPPPDVWRVDGEGLLALPAFLDACTRTGCETPEPEKDQDRPADVRSDVRVDMRRANRKGIQPSVRAAALLDVSDETAEKWNEAGFAAALVAPAGELLAGTSALAVLRHAAPRDAVVRGEVFQHAAFEASGPGYPRTPMGHVAQLRQFFLDARRQRELEERAAAGRPGLRPPWDAELRAAAPLLAGEQRVACRAEEAGALRRWLRVADELGLAPVVVGGREAWRAADELVERDVPVLLTLDWGDEVEDPLADEEGDEGDEEPEGEEEEEEEEEGPPEDVEAPAEEEEAEPAIAERFRYYEPVGVRAERRRLWEEGRDCALRLHEAGVRFAFATDGGEPGELLERVRTLVEEGLPAEAGLAALTSGAAEILGVGDRLGRIAPGYDATFVLWEGDPLTDDEADARRVVVDGFVRELERGDGGKKEERDEDEDEPDDVEGVR